MIKHEYILIGILSVAILIPVILVIVTSSAQRADQAALEDNKEKLINDDGETFLRKATSTVKWRMIALASIFLAIVMTVILFVMLYLFSPGIETLRLVILLEFVSLLCFLSSYVVIYSIMNYYDYHYLIVQPDK